MPLLTDVEAQMKTAMRAHEQVRLDALRLIKAALVNKAVEKGRDLDETESRQVLTSLVKQRRESIEQFEKGGRHDLVARERAELAVVETFLPPPIDPAEIEKAVEAAIASTGATSGKDMGKVMKAVMVTLAGTGADGKAVNEAVRRRLAG